ncbi:hypothetical protein FDG92_gp41 [Arthrobacter phage Jasmine]|uniref:Uncharacterized protein n=1 Tax=Arthrobacter phage Jasmine TaxID=1772302 RepID=A0A0U4B3J7_9CAUD|nr:hypothetical protein FDG92_gp41 [Arthrobacter phage Jasmine]ALY09312.1 hypothetical protein JASMINE_42 [Arthrobacter phage Jasmine]
MGTKGSRESDKLTDEVKDAIVEQGNNDTTPRQFTFAKLDDGTLVVHSYDSEYNLVQTNRVNISVGRLMKREEWQGI